MISGPIKAIEISDLLETPNDRVVRVLLPSGKQLNLKRGLVDFAPGKVLMPLWLYERIFKIKKSKNAGV